MREGIRWKEGGRRRGRRRRRCRKKEGNFSFVQSSVCRNLVVTQHLTQPQHLPFLRFFPVFPLLSKHFLQTLSTKEKARRRKQAVHEYNRNRLRLLYDIPILTLPLPPSPFPLDRLAAPSASLPLLEVHQVLVGDDEAEFLAEAASGERGRRKRISTRGEWR
jgi:hypothetical protein